MAIFNPGDGIYSSPCAWSLLSPGLFFLKGREMLVQCAWCRMVNDNGKWRAFKDWDEVCVYVHNEDANLVSHGMCPECQKRWGRGEASCVSGVDHVKLREEKGVRYGTDCG